MPPRPVSRPTRQGSNRAPMTGSEPRICCAAASTVRTMACEWVRVRHEQRIDIPGEIQVANGIVLLNLKFFARRDDSRRHGPQADLAAAGWCGRSSEC